MRYSGWLTALRAKAAQPGTYIVPRAMPKPPAVIPLAHRGRPRSARTRTCPRRRNPRAPHRARPLCGDAGQPALQQAIAALHRCRTGLRDTRPRMLSCWRERRTPCSPPRSVSLGRATRCWCPADLCHLPSHVRGNGCDCRQHRRAPRTSSLRLDPEALARAVTPRTRAIAFANPGNPRRCGADARGARSHRRHRAPAQSLRVVADEVYADLVYEGEHLSSLPCPVWSDGRSR